MRTIDDTEIEEVIEEPAQSQGMRIIGDDEIEEEVDSSSIIDKEIPLTPFFDPTLRDVADQGIEAFETLGDTAAGAVEGGTFGGADELAGAGMTAIEKVLGYIPGTGAYQNRKFDEEFKASGGTVPEESLTDIYSQYQQTSEKGFKDAAKRSPIGNFVGNLSGSIATGIATGNAMGVFGAAKNAKPILDVAKDSGKLKAGLELLKRGGVNYAKAFPIIAAEGVLNSDEQLVGQNANVEGVLEDVGDNLAFGVPTILGMQGISDVAAPYAKKGVQAGIDKIDNLVGDTPFMRKAKKAFEFGEQGINPVSEPQKNKLLKDQVTRSSGLTDEILTADEKLGQYVGESLEKAEMGGQLVDIERPIMDSIDALNYSYETFKNIDKNSRGRQIFNNIANKVQKGIVKPTEAKDLLDDVDAFIGKFQAVGQKTSTDSDILDALFEVRENLSKTIKDQIPEYRKTAERFADFRRSFVEPIIAGEKPTDFKKVYYGKLRGNQEKLYDRVNNMAIESTGQGSGVENTIKAVENAKEGLNTFKANEAARNQTSIFDDSGEFFNKIRSSADEAQMLRDMQTVKSPHITTKNLLAGVAEFGHGGALVGANVAGKVSKPITNISKKVYNMPAEALSKYAAKLQTIPGLERYGKAIQDALANGDQAKKNAALFSLMQNPQARLIFNSEEDEGM